MKNVTRISRQKLQGKTRGRMRLGLLKTKSNSRNLNSLSHPKSPIIHEFSRRGPRKTFKLWVVSFAAFLAAWLGMFSASMAADLQWGGLYRFEGVRVNNAELDGKNTDKAYMLHHLVMKPKIVAADGVTIFGRFDLLNNSTVGMNNQVGEFIGKGVGTGTPTNAGNSNVISRQQESGGLAVTQMYMSWAQEFGQLIVGRAPLHFGLGTSYNSGAEAFDHYFTTLDMVSYKVIAGNFFIMPILGKVNEGSLNREDDVNDYILHFQYDNPETDLSMGLMYAVRVGTGNDIPVNNSYYGGTGSTRVGDYKHNLISLFSSQRLGASTVGVEAQILSGDTGVRTTSGTDVKLNAFAVAAEVDWKPETGPWSADVKLGFVSGDDPGSQDTHEGFVFSQNYRVGTLMFQHPLGRADFFRTGMVRDTTTAASTHVNDEAVSNVLYLAPTVHYRQSDTWSYFGRVLTARLNKDPIQNSNTNSDLGYELDFGMEWRPFDRLQWVTEIGALLPGEAWKGGTSAFDNKVVYGIQTKAAIHF
ncbi:MAG TPA: hypothetical protein PLZ57_04995 [Pseudobdellovibrionaceae bacterium]|nr:hypothetical protein [Pseudobdellovibrionaceae bacterium]